MNKNDEINRLYLQQFSGTATAAESISPFGSFLPDTEVKIRVLWWRRDTEGEWILPGEVVLKKNGRLHRITAIKDDHERRNMGIL